MRRLRRQAALLVGIALLAACRHQAADETALVAGTGQLDETALALASGAAPTATAGGGGPLTGPTDAGAGAAAAVAPPGSASIGATSTTAPRTSGTTTTAPSSTSSAAPPTSAAELEPLMVVNGPPGYERDDDKEAENGAIDFDAAVYHDGEEDSAAFFRRHGFEGGWDRSWSAAPFDPDSEEPFRGVYDTLYRFRAASGAKAYMDRAAEYYEDGGFEESGVSTFTVAGVPGAKGYAMTDPEYGSEAAVLFTKDRYTVVIVSSEVSVDKAKEFASAMARDQYGRL